MLFFTGSTRDSRKILNEQSDNNESKRKMLEIAKVENLSDIALKNKQDKNAALRNLRNNRMSIRDIERMTGISRGVISRV